MDTLDIDELAALLRISAKSALELAESGELGARIGTRWVFIRDDVIAWLREQTRKQQAARRAREEGEQRVSTVLNREHRRKRKLPQLPESV